MTLLSIEVLKLDALKYQLEFHHVPLVFRKHEVRNLFALKNNKTVAETLLDRRYVNLSKETYRLYPDSINERLGEFLYNLKIKGDGFYKRFLNKYGDDEYCEFYVATTVLTKAKGVYCFVTDGSIKYFGRSHDPFEQRLNQGYGRISPKNCFKDGQSTNCHINSMIAKNHDSLSFYVCSIDGDREIDEIERTLIRWHRPEWNISS